MNARELITLLTALCDKENAGGCGVIMSAGTDDTEVVSARKEVMVNGSEFVFLYGKEE